MTDNENWRIRHLGAGDLELMDGMPQLFGEVFDETETYNAARPDAAYTSRLLGSERCIALAAVSGDTVVGALTAYLLPKFEQPRSEIYIYDLAVDAGLRRHGIATALIEAVVEIGARLGARVVMVQADRGDEPAIALYDKLGRREDILHFDIAVEPVPGGGYAN